MYEKINFILKIKLRNKIMHLKNKSINYLVLIK